MRTYFYFRSVYSLLSSMCDIEEFVKEAKAKGYFSIALVDHNVLAGAMVFHKACLKHQVKDLYGLEFELKVEDRIINVILYAKNDDGYQNLMKLSTFISLNEKKVVDLDTLNQYRENNVLVLFSDDMFLTYYLDKKLAISEALSKQETYFKNYYVALVDHDININKIRDEQIEKILFENKIPYICLNRTYYLNKDDVEAYEVLKCIKDKTILKDVDKAYQSGRYQLTIDEMSSSFSKAALINSDNLAQKLNVSLDFETCLPKYQNKSSVSSKDYLVSLCNEGLRRRLKNHVTKEYQLRLNHELKVILKMNYEDYFLIVYDFVLYAKKNQILVGPGRGSACGSLIAYCLGITDIDPIKYGLIFERFLNSERISMPDIDTDFPDVKRNQVIEYVADKYGKEHVAHIITYGTLRAKQVIRDVSRVLDINIKEADGISKLLPNSLDLTLDSAYENIPLFNQKINSDYKLKKLFAISKKLEFKPRHESTHAAGIVFSSKALSDVVPLTRVEKDLDSTQYTMEHLEELGLIKMDFLGLRNLSIIAEICDDINQNESFNIHDIPLDDENTFKLIDDNNVLGIFQLESSGMRNLIKKMKPKSFEEISMCIALFRPGPMKNIPLFLENKEHPEKIDYIHPSIENILKETYGIIVYQEQIMNIARVMANFSYSKADILRAAMSKKKASVLEKLYPDFIDGCLKNNYDMETSKKVYDLILEFANYGFNKSHSIAYGMVAYQMAYLKANYRSYFYKALLNGVIGDKNKTYEYLFECINTKQKVKGININESIATYLIKDDYIRMPFGICADLGSITIEKILDERNKGIFKDYIDTVYRLNKCGCSKKVIENLIKAGAFDDFGYSRKTMLNSLDNCLNYANVYGGLGFVEKPTIDIYEDSIMDCAENEKEVLGFYFSHNPVIAMKKKYHIDIKSVCDGEPDSNLVKGFGLITRVNKFVTRKGNKMAKVYIMDDKSSITLVFWPKLYQVEHSKLVVGKYLYYEGRQEREDSCIVKTMRIY